jgi:hypothetical protein
MSASPFRIGATTSAISFGSSAPAGQQEQQRPVKRKRDQERQNPQHEDDDEQCDGI